MEGSEGALLNFFWPIGKSPALSSAFKLKLDGPAHTVLAITFEGSAHMKTAHAMQTHKIQATKK